MKKLICLGLVFVFLFSFAGCKKDKNNTDENGVDIKYYASLGQMPECEYKLGTPVEDIKNALTSEENTNSEQDHDHETYQIIEGAKSVLIDCGNFGYYYLKEKENNGISYIVNYGKAYGFETGTLITDVKTVLGELEYFEEAVTNENAFFMLTAGGTLLKYNFEKYTVLFVFENNALCATAIYLTEDWQ